MSKKIDLSIIITAHNEGLIAHKTMLSVFEATKQLENIKKNYEIIIHIDNGDVTTKKYFERYKEENNIVIFENNFCDTGPSRNFAARQAKGEYIAFLDGDDLVSDNWFTTAICEMEKKSNNNAIIHPEAILTFGIEQPNVLTIQKNSDQYQSLPLVLLGENCWCSTLIMRRELFLQTSYRAVKNGYAHEDYIFNVETISVGIKHIVAPKTTLFYRRSNNSRLLLGRNENAIIPYMELFDFDNIKKIKVAQNKDNVKTKLYKTYKKIRNNRKLNFFITPFAKVAIKIIYPKRCGAKRVPDFVIDSWRKINQIETQLYPHNNILSNVQLFTPEVFLPVGKAYHEVSQHFTHKPNYIFIVPWLIRGGADKVILNYIKALKEIHPTWHFTIIATLPSNNAWRDLLPDYVDFIDFGNSTTKLNPDQQDILFSRIITQLQCKNLHIMNSEFGFLWAIRHQTLIRKNYKLTVSLFCFEYIPSSNLRGIFSYDDPYMIELYPVTNRIFTDNQAIIDYSIQKNGFLKDKFRVHYQPIEAINISSLPTRQKTDSKLHILWASRITNAKIPQVVAEIGKKLNPNKFVIDVYGVFDATVAKNIFNNIPTIKYHGQFNGFSSLPIQDEDLFLYTSLTDGVPNVILEATAAGLPIIASNDGGVSEVIKNEETGILIQDPQNVDAYIEAIKKYDEPTFAKYAQNAQNLLKKQHSWDSFIKQIKKDF